MRTREYNALMLRKAKKEWRSAAADWERANVICVKATRALIRKFTMLDAASKALDQSYSKLQSLREASKSKCHKH